MMTVYFEYLAFVQSVVKHMWCIVLWWVAMKYVDERTEINAF